MKERPIVRFWKLLRIYKKELRQIYALAIIIGIVNLTLPLGIQAIINFLQTGTFTSTWLLLVGFVLIGIAIAGFLQILQIRVVEYIQQDVFVRSALEFSFRIPKIKLLAFDDYHTLELANRFFDTMTIQKGLPKILIDFSLGIFQILFGLILLSIYSPYFIVLGIVLTFVLWLIFKFTGSNGLRTSIKESNYKYKLAHWLEEIARVNRSIKVYDHGAAHMNKTDGIVGDYLQHRNQHFNVLLTQFWLFVGFKIIVAAGLLLLGGFLVFQDQMNIGQFVAAEIIILLILNSIEKLILTVENIYDVLTALDKIGFVIDMPLDSNLGKATINADTGLSIVANEIHFSFPENNKIIQGLSLTIHSNDKVLLKGESGSGKSILLQILAGFYAIDGGELLINDLPINNYNRLNYNTNIAIHLPVNQLFEGSFRENILMGRKIDEHHLGEVLKALNINRYIAHRPEGLDAHIDSGGKKLPRSVIQKILIARLIVGAPKLILMEDPLQYIDDSEKNSIVDYIMDSQRNWTVIIISDYYYWKEKSNRTVII